MLSLSASNRQDKTILYSRTTSLAVLFTMLLVYDNFYILTIENGIGLYGGMFHINAYTQIFNIFILIISGVILGLNSFYFRKVLNEKTFSLKKMFSYKNLILNKTGEQYKILEYPLILLFIVTGATFLISTSDLVSIFLSIELQSYGLYLLSTVYRNSESSTKAGLTYFLLGGLSSCIILLAQSILYANSGNTSLDNLYIINNISDISKENESINSFYNSYYINFSLILLSVGFLFKVSAAPFHFWSPDVYDAVPTIVTTFIAIVAKISIFVFFLELVHYTSNLAYFSWSNNLLLSSLLSLIIGTVLGLVQFRIKRLYAYSTISHLGFILLSLSIYSIESIQAFIFYLIQYSITNLNAFILLLSIGYFYIFSANNFEEKIKSMGLKDENNSPIQLISQIKGHYEVNPVLALSLGITLFSFLGVPPLMGFFAKQMVLSAALDNGYIFMTLLAILTSVISAVYYLAVIKQIFFDKNEYNIKPSIVEYSNNSTSLKNNITLSSYISITISVITLLITLFMFIPEEWLNMTNILTLIIFNL